MLEGALDVMFRDLRPCQSGRAEPKVSRSQPHNSTHVTVRRPSLQLSAWKNGSPGLIRTGGRPSSSQLLFNVWETQMGDDEVEE